MNLESENDDFFGDQSEEDDDNEHVNSLGIDDMNTKKSGLSERELNAIQENFRNIGFLEGFEESKEARIQDGFESGYKEIIESSSKLGRTFGQKAIAAFLNQSIETDFSVRKASQNVKHLLMQYDNEMKKPNKNSDGDAYIKEVIHKLESLS